MTTLWEKADVNLDGVLSKKEVVTLLQSMNVKSDTRYSRALTQMRVLNELACASSSS
jgi:hypothetical protein